MRDFKDLEVWKKAILLFEKVVKEIEAFPRTEVSRVIVNQIIRSISSVSANIAEGYGRRKGKEYEHYLYVARGSVNESMDWLEKLKRLKYVGGDAYTEMNGLCEEIRAMLTKMIDTLEKR